MGRPTRIDHEGAWHHVMNRGGRHGLIYLDDEDRQLFLRLLAMIARRSGVEIYAYCLMGNHFHLVLHCPRGGLSAAMQLLSATYTRRFNERHGFDGPLFRSRFESKLIDSDDYLLQVTRYVHRNPLDIGCTDLAGYPWSSYAVYLGHRTAPWWLEREMVLALSGNDQARLRDFVELDGLDRSTEVAASRPTPSPIRSAPANSEAAEAGIEAIERAVAAAAGCDTTDLHTVRPGRRNLPRAVAILLMAERLAMAPGRLAECYGLTAPSSARNAVRRSRQLLETDSAARDLHDRAEELLQEQYRAAS